jgi:hypothetical protein
MSYVKIADDFKQLPSEGASNTTHQASFFFDVPEHITVPSFEKVFTHQLPPSIRVVKTASSTEFPENCRAAIAGHCDITYHIEARISRRGKVVCYTRREIILMPTTETPPPLDPGDLKHDYRLLTALSLGSFWKPKKTISITVSSKEPRPVVFPYLKGEWASGNTEVLLDFKARKTFDDEDSFLEPPVTECELMITLEAITYFLEHETDQVLSIAETRRCPCAILKRKRFKTQKRKVKLEGWKRVNDGACEYQQVDHLTPRRNSDVGTSVAATRIIEWDATIPLMTLIPDDIPRLPSFFSSLVSRRYAFDVEIVLRTKLGVSNKPVHLRIPVQIVHAPVGKCPGGPPELEFEDNLKAPAYVP